MIVFVHGVPETAAMWADIQGRLDAESTAVALPGFGVDQPPGFGAGTKDDHARWLVGELDSIVASSGGPVDLVGHDWGAGLAYRVVTASGSPDRVRSWVADVGNIAHPDYEWHDIAKIWQTPGDGEAFVASQATGDPAERAPLFESMGVPPAGALEMASASDDRMGAAILALYRSALPNPHADWGPWSPTAAPGLILHPSDDPFSDERMAAEVATSLGARFEVLPGAGHFWPYQAPDAAAELLQRFWSTLP